MADNIAKVVMLDRSVYDAQTHDTNTIYFVREGTPSLSNVLSLYVGDAFQCDILYIDENEVTFDQTSNEYHLPEKYHIRNKLLFYKQSIVTDKIDSSTDETYDFFRICMWDGEKFRDTGLPNNLIVCSEHLPDTSNGIKDFTYIDVTNRNIYVFDGNSYIPILELSQYATKEWVEEYHNSHQQSVDVDNITVLKTDQNVLHAAGADVSGVESTVYVDSTDYTEKSAEGAYVFNDVGRTNLSIAKYPCSSIFGVNNKEFGCAGTVGSGAYEYVYDPQNPPDKSRAYEFGCNIITGHDNTVRGGNQSFISGGYNQIRSYNNGRIMHATILGESNTLKSTARSSPVFIQGLGNQLNYSGTSPQYVSVMGNQNSLSTSDTFTYGTTQTVIVSGYLNSVYNTGISASASLPDGTYILGCRNTVSNCTSVYLNGDNNHVSTSNSSPYPMSGTFLYGYTNNMSCPGNRVFVYGSDNTLQKNIPDVSEGTRFSIISVVGSGNQLNLDSSGSEYVGVYGFNSKVYGSKCSTMLGWANTLNNHEHCHLIGDNLTSFADNTVVIGKYNDTNVDVIDPRVVIAAGSSAVGDTQNSIIIDGQNNIHVYGDTISTSNFTSTASDISLVSNMIGTTITPSSGVCHLDKLPSNNDETIINSSSTVDTLQIDSLNVPLQGGTSTAVSNLTDYCATIAFRKGVGMLSADTILTNFNPSSVSQDPPPRIYLLNPDIDISDFTVIHLLLFYDGFNMCCTVSGYMEDTTP